MTTDIFFFWGGSLFGPRPIRIRILMPSPYSYLPELATTDRIAGALHTGAHLSSLRHCLRGRPTLFSPKGEPTFLPLGMCILGHQRRPLCARYLGGVSLAGFPSLHLFATRYVRWRHFPPLMPILYSRTSEETTLRPLFGRGFIGGFSFPPLFATRYVRWRHMTLRRETTTTGLESFPSLCARYMGGVFYPGFPSCGRRAGS